MTRETPPDYASEEIARLESELLGKDSVPYEWSEKKISEKIQELTEQRKVLYAELKKVLSLDDPNHTPDENESPFDIDRFKAITEELHKIRLRIRQGRELLEKIKKEKTASAKKIYKDIHPKMGHEQEKLAA